MRAYVHACVHVCVWVIPFLRLLFIFAASTKEVDDNCYQEKLCELQDEVAKTIPKVSSVKRLMVGTFGGRREWILKDEPSVAEVLAVFPLRQSSRVSASYRMAPCKVIHM